MTEERILKALKEEFHLPTGYDICVRAMENILGNKKDNSENNVFLGLSSLFLRKMKKNAK